MTDILPFEGTPELSGDNYRSGSEADLMKKKEEKEFGDSLTTKENRKLAKKKIKEKIGQVITEEMIEELRSPRGAWTRDFFLAVGETWPIRSGWRKRIIGKVVR